MSIDIKYFLGWLFGNVIISTTGLKIQRKSILLQLPKNLTGRKKELHANFNISNEIKRPKHKKLLIWLTIDLSLMVIRLFSNAKFKTVHLSGLK